VGGHMDLKIEIRKLYALHDATIRFDHAIKMEEQTAWTGFTPSRFIYAFFTFNSIYSFDWETSFNKREAIRWSDDKDERVPKEDAQIKSYLKFADSELKPKTADIFSKELTNLLTLYGIEQPKEELDAVDMVNATKKLKNLSRQLPGQFERILKGRSGAEDFLPSACAVFEFVYGVRCNLFHGSKTTVQLLNPAQQRRLLIYTAALIAGNSLLFRVAEKADIGWRKVNADFNLTAREA
jgi:hypothetical protein